CLKSHTRGYRRRAYTRVSDPNQPGGAADSASSVASGAGSVARVLRLALSASVSPPTTQTNPVLDTLKGESSGWFGGPLSPSEPLAGPSAGANGSSSSGRSASPTPGSSPLALNSLAIDRQSVV